MMTLLLLTAGVALLVLLAGAVLAVLVGLALLLRKRREAARRDRETLARVSGRGKPGDQP